MSNSHYKNYFEYALFLALNAVARVLPRRLALKLGAGIGSLTPYLLPRRRQIAHANLRRAYPEKSEAEIRAIMAKMFRHLGKSGFEMLLVDRFKAGHDLESFFEIHGLENLHDAYALDRGVFLLSGHIGFWEVGTFFLGALGFPADFVAKQMRNPYIGRHFEKLREAGGGRVIDARQGARKIVRSLAEKRVVCVLLDQHTSPKTSVKVDFFGRPAYTTPIITQIAMKYDVPIVPAFTYRTGDDRYRVYFEPALRLPNDPTPEAIVEQTARLTSCIEAAVRKDPHQWFWVHRRWRDKPGRP
ncbi:MAG TPA: lysophospholipid acyltransferase family protein [Desulfuromonadales bacterium]|nr:lysophospholipid acyltransferase family protein [Desulfuromonadales bacterium]